MRLNDADILASAINILTAHLPSIQKATVRLANPHQGGACESPSTIHKLTMSLLKLENALPDKRELCIVGRKDEDFKENWKRHSRSCSSEASDKQDNEKKT